jgi:transcriptional regulator with XRE-family HTH domain
VGITQQSIAAETGLSQSQVSRLLSGKAKRRTTALDAVCKYVERATKGVASSDVRECATLLESLALVWDGSENHAEALAVVIRSLGGLTVRAGRR